MRAAALTSYLLGLAIICLLNLAVTMKVMAGIGWTSFALVEWWLISFSHGRYRRLQVAADGGAAVLDRHGQWQAATVCAGSVVLRRVAWLGLKVAGGGRYFGLVRGNCRENEQWRRLQVIWRHLGRADRSC